MSRYLAVIHAWHVESKWFQTHELKSQDPKSAEGEAALLAMKAQGTCRSADYHLIELADRDCLMPRRLTWRERLTGTLEVSP